MTVCRPNCFPIEVTAELLPVHQAASQSKKKKLIKIHLSKN